MIVKFAPGSVVRLRFKLVRALVDGEWWYGQRVPNVRGNIWMAQPAEAGADSEIKVLVNTDHLRESDFEKPTEIIT